MNSSLLRKIYIIVILITSLAISGCQLLNQKQTGSVEIDNLELHSVKNQDEVIERSISLLEKGKNSLARAGIDQVLRVNPRHPTAVLLNKMLTQPPQVIFETERFVNYKVKAGDTLGSIVETWLGDSIYFVSVARLNKISNPTRIFPGMTLKIPVIETSPLVKKERQRSAANLKLLTRFNQEKRFFKTLQKLDELFVVPTDQIKLMAIQSETLDSLSESSASISSRYQMIEKVNQFFEKAHRPFLAPQYQKFIRNQKQQILVEEFLLLFEDQSYLESAEKLIEANSLGDSLRHIEKVSEPAQRLVDKLHEEAIIMRKNQRLNEAMVRWKTILKIEPNNELAQKYYIRTNKLVNKLKQLN